MTITDPLRARLTIERDAPDDPGPAGWRDELVTLLVLAEHGDDLAASRLERWLTIDPVARSWCTTMARDLGLLRETS